MSLCEAEALFVFQRGFHPRAPGFSEGANSGPRRCFVSDGASPAPNPGSLLRGLRAPEPLYGACPAPNPGFTFVRTKVNRKSASPLWAGPRLFPNRTPAKLHCAATEIPFCRWLLVIGLMGHRLRLTALGMIGTSGRAGQIDSFIPLTGRQPKLESIPGRDQIPEGSANSVATHYLSLKGTD